MQVDIVWGSKPVIIESQLAGLDVEGALRSIRLVQIAIGQTAYLYDLSVEEHRANCLAVLSDERLEFITHSRYDGDGLWWTLGIDLTGRIRDTYLLACLVFPGGHLPHGLKELTARYIDGELQAGEQALHALFKETYGWTTVSKTLKSGEVKTRRKAVDQDVWKSRGYLETDVHHPLYEWYSAADAVYCLKLYEVLKRLHKMGKGAQVNGDTFFIQQYESDALGLASLRGMMVDRERVQRLQPVEERAVTEANEKMQQLIGLPAGSVKVGLWLEEHGVEFLERTDTGGPKLDKHALNRLVMRYPEGESLVGDVIAARRKRSKASNRLANLNNFLAYSEDDGFVHTNFKTAAAATGRMSSTSPAMQTLSKEEGDTSLRGCFVARPGHIFVGADFDTQEMRLAAAMSGDSILAGRILGGADMHALAAEAIVGPGWTAHDRNTVGKTSNFACAYGVGGFGFAKQTGLDVWAEVVVNWEVVHVEKRDMDAARAMAESQGGYVRWAGPAAEAVAAWWAQYPEFEAWNKENKRKCKAGELGGYIELDSGRWIPVEAPHKVTNSYIQGTGRDITGKALQIVEKKMPGTLAMVLHDELLLEVPEGRVGEGLTVLNEAMNFTFESKVCQGLAMPITATAEVMGDRWRKL